MLKNGNEEGNKLLWK